MADCNLSDNNLPDSKLSDKSPRADMPYSGNALGEKRLHLICFGNPLHGDDGVGHYVYTQLAQLQLPEGIKLYDAGVMGLTALPLFEQCDQVLLIDAIETSVDTIKTQERSSTEPAATGLVQLTDIDTVINQGHREGLDYSGDSHISGLAYLLKAVNALVIPLPSMRLIGIQVTDIRGFEPGISPAVKEVADELIEALAVYLTGYPESGKWPRLAVVHDTGQFCYDTDK